MELVLIKAFLEIDKAYMRHAHLSADGKYEMFLCSLVTQELNLLP